MSRPVVPLAAPADPAVTKRAARAARNPPVLILFVAVAGFLTLGLRLLPVGTQDLGVAGLFSTDEQLAGALVKAMLEHGNLGLSHFFSYGPLDLYAARALLWLVGLVRPLDDRAILIALRCVSLLAGGSCLAVTYRLGRRLWDAWTGALAALLLALSPTFFAWSTTAHPDLLQLLFLLLGLDFAATLALRGGRRALLLASVCAALAFATKYGGVLLLPLIWLAALAPRARGWGTLRSDLMLSLALFMAVFSLIDPNALAEPRRFLSQVRIESELAHHGHLYAGAIAPFDWLRLLGNADLLGPVALLAAVAGLIAWTRSELLAIPRRPAFFPARLILAVWTLGYLLLLLVWIGDRQPRYALPVLPGLLLFAAAALVWLARRAPAGRLLLIITLLAAVLPPGLRLAAYERTEARRLDNPAVRERIAAGRWLMSQVAASAPVLRDAYSYLPPSFSNVQETFGLTAAQIETIRPGIIITDAAIRDRFRDPASASHYRDGAAAYQEIAATYAALEAGALPCFPLLHQFGPVRIYGHLDAAACVTAASTNSLFPPSLVPTAYCLTPNAYVLFPIP